MFDSYYRVANNNVPRHISVKENRAPTDESVRLLKEMEQEAKNKLIDTIDLDNNILKGKILIFEDYLNYAYKIRALLKINGKKYEFNCKVSRYVGIGEEMYKQIYELIGAKITRMLMNDIQQS